MVNDTQIKAWCAIRNYQRMIRLQYITPFYDIKSKTMELRTTRQKVEKIEEYLKKNGYFSSSAKDDRYKFYTYYKYLMPRVIGETGCYIKVEMMHAYAHEWYVTAQIKLFRADGISRIYHYAEIQRAMLDVNDMGRVNKLAELVLNNKELIMG